MASTRIPPELFDNILAHVEDGHDLVRQYKHTEARRETLRSLSNCSLVCVYWANSMRSRMFQILVLHSAKDLYDLLALLRMPCSSRIWSIAQCLRIVAVFYRLTDYFWCHDLQRLQANGVYEDFVLRIHISGLAPCKEDHTVRHPLFYTIPRMVPFHRNPLIYVDLIIEAVRFLNGAGLLNLIRDISYSGISPRSVRCNRVRWEDGLTPLIASLDPTFLLNHHTHYKPFDVITSDCTNNSLVNLATQCCIQSGRRKGLSMLSTSDADQFLDIFRDWVSLVNADLGYHPSPCRSRAFITSGNFVREEDNPQLPKVDQLEANSNVGVAGYLWRMDVPSQGWHFISKHNDIVEFGFYMRRLRDQGHGVGAAQTAYICSIVIAVMWHIDWKTILHKALEFPMLDTIKVFVHGWHELRYFVHRHREILAVAESQGRLRLCLLEGKGYSIKNEYYSRQVDLSEVIDLINTDESAMEFEGVIWSNWKPKSLQPVPEDWRRVVDAEIESERAFNEARYEA